MIEIAISLIIGSVIGAAIGWWARSVVARAYAVMMAKEIEEIDRAYITTPKLKEMWKMGMRQ